MKKTLITCLCLVCWVSIWGQSSDLLRFKISRPYCVLNFLETIKGSYGTSEALRQYIAVRTEGDTAFERMRTDYRALHLDMSMEREGYPPQRFAMRSTLDLIIIAAVQADNFDAFKDRIWGILPQTDQLILMDLLQKADIYYEKIIWAEHGEAAKGQMEQLKNYQKQANQAFLTFRQLYNSTWADDAPFTVALIPVPGNRGNTSATPHANTLCVDVLTEGKDQKMRMGIIMHEICHVLFSEQSRRVQHDIEGYFAQNPSPFAAVAHNFFDEGMATACGNGWAYNFFAGKMDTTSWYNNPYIDGFGHALFPLVSRYIAEKKAIDAAFVAEAIRLFGEKFPQAVNSYGVQFNSLILHADTDIDTERLNLQDALRQYFSIMMLNTSTPILEPESLGFLKEEKGAHLVVVDRNHETTLKTLKSTLPELKNINYDLRKNFVISFFDAKKRFIVVAKIEKGDYPALFKALYKREFMNPKEPYWTF